MSTPRSGLPMRRRQFLLTALAAAISACGSGTSEPAGQSGSASIDTTFPTAVTRYRQPFENWAREFSFPDMLTCAPVSADAAVAIINWAAINGYTVRARGAMHNWSPLTLAPGTSAATRTLLLDTTQHLTDMAMLSAPMPAVRAGTGVLMEDLLAYLEAHDAGFTATPAVGAITLGGALAINGHGCAVPASGESALPRQTYGSLSNRVLALTAIVWLPDQQRYGLRQFDRRESDIGVLLTALGRTFITDVTLAVEPNQNLRCVSHIDIPASEMFAAPGSGGRDMASFLDSSGRLEA
ncbi:MAG: FAD-binding protein, partial [Perlucidibaca sp.]